jgi:hypothetical protein
MTRIYSIEGWSSHDTALIEFSEVDDPDEYTQEPQNLSATIAWP